MQTWNYISQDESIRHMGPMARDFYAAFELGIDDKHITTIDADGLALAVILTLHRMIQQQQSDNWQLLALVELQIRLGVPLSQRR